MVSAEICDYIRRFPDHRKHGVRYRFGSMLLLTLLGYLCGRDSLKGVWRFGQSLTKPQRKRLGFREGKLPTHPALCNAFHGVDAEKLCAYLRPIVMRDVTDEPLHLAIDGKRLRGSRQGEHAGVHVISAFATQLHATLGSTEMGDTNEAKAALKLLDQLTLNHTLVTGDAMFTRKDICHKITEKGGDYLLPVKGNNAPLQQAIEQELKTTKKSA